jgi:hypothetical protein
VPTYFHARATEWGIPDSPFTSRGAHDGIADSETKAGSTSFVSGSAESIEERQSLLGRNTRPVILNREDDPVSLCEDSDLHRALLAGITARVVDKHCGQLVNPFWRSIDPWMASSLEGHSEGDAPS